ncbi:hypothetical protein AQUCO_00100829v1 [Aquilegia coerulea]|uniref:F-box domain-containing protein n=1 Tax=Aquilegia coerulea TaxID=218851 RepID=A0A2G5FC63_AQUCA|nr:hypothetical protein AQUCO_00100829v1 [Aquilegia coerulea]
MPTEYLVLHFFATRILIEMEERTLLPCSKPNILKLPEYKETNNDRFNDLPDAMLLHILSFLDMKEVLDASLISKRWRYLWVSVPAINIDGSYWEDKKKLFRDFVENVVLRHDESNIYKFNLVYLSQLTDMHQTTKWVSYAVSRQVQELDLNTLSLSPTPSLFCRVKIMKLICVSFPLLSKDYVFDFSVLEYLFLKNCYYGPLKNLTISAPHLKTFLVENFPLAPCCAVKIQSPKLTSFQLNGFMYEDYALDQLSSLVTAEFHVITRKSRMKNEVLIENLRTVLGVLTNAESLTLSTDVFQVCHPSTPLLSVTLTYNQQISTYVSGTLI